MLYAHLINAEPFRAAANILKQSFTHGDSKYFGPDKNAQDAAKDHYITMNTMIFNGNAGSGKTTITQALDYLLNFKLDLSTNPVVLLAPQED